MCLGVPAALPGREWEFAGFARSQSPAFRRPSLMPGVGRRTRRLAEYKSGAFAAYFPVLRLPAREIEFKDAALERIG